MSGPSATRWGCVGAALVTLYCAGVAALAPSLLGEPALPLAVGILGVSTSVLVLGCLSALRLRWRLMVAISATTLVGVAALLAEGAAGS